MEAQNQNSKEEKDPKNSQFATDLKDSEDAWKQQFDRESEHYHKGDSRPIPTGGESLPKLLDQEFVEIKGQKVSVCSENPIDTKLSDYGPEHDEFMAIRSTLTDLKNLAAKICTSIEVKRKNNEIIDPNSTDEKIKNKNAKMVEKDQGNLDTAFDNLQKFSQNLSGKHSIVQYYKAAIEEILEGAKTNYEDKEKYANYMFMVRKHTQKIGQDQKKLLEDIKKIKKQKEAEAKNTEDLEKVNLN